MEKQLDAGSGAALSRDEFTSVITSVIASLEPDQIVSTKQQHHCPRRRLTRTEMILFWGLRIYLVFMVGVVVYQIWTGVR